MVNIRAISGLFRKKRLSISLSQPCSPYAHFDHFTVDQVQALPRRLRAAVIEDRKARVTRALRRYVARVRG